MREPALIGLMVLGLSGCGFTPIYASTHAGSSLRHIAISAPEDRLGYRLREQLEDALAFDRSTAPQWRMQVQVEQSRRPLGRRIDDTATRYELVVKASWSLTSVAGDPGLAGTETVTTTYAAADQPYGAISAQQDGEDRAAAELSRLIRLDILRGLSGR